MHERMLTTARPTWAAITMTLAPAHVGHLRPDPGRSRKHRGAGPQLAGAGARALPDDRVRISVEDSRFGPRGYAIRDRN